MPLYVKAGGAWQGVGDGRLRVKAGGAWQSPAYCYVKSAGAWRDTGYRGYPNNPSAPWVHSWGYGHLQTAWNYASGGPPISSYHVVLTDVYGNWIAEEYSGDNVSPSWGVGQDTRYQVYVRSIGSNGLAGPFQGPLRVGIGHPETYNYGWVQRTRGWYSQLDGANWYQGAYDGTNPGGTVVWVPNSVYITAMHMDVWANGGFTGTLSPYGNRYISHVFAGGNWNDQISMPGNHFYTIEYGYGNWGQDNWWGLMANGAGWSIYPDGVQRAVGALGIEGTEYYNNWEVVSTNPAQGNYYW